MTALVIDAEPQIRRALRLSLEQHGFTVLLAASSEEGLDYAAQHQPDIILVDLELPHMNGLEVCRRLREWSRLPVIILSACHREQEKIAALELGADDYVTKPFHMGELLARMNAVLRRFGSGGSTAPGAVERQFSVGELQIDYTRRQVTRSGNEVHLTPTEYELLRHLTLNSDRVLTHEQLLTKVWGEEHAEDHHTLRVHIANLRRKIEAQPSRPQFLQTEARVGYRFRVERSGHLPHES